MAKGVLAGNEWPSRPKGGRRTQKERKARAFHAYLELLDAADWIRHELRGQLEMFGLTIEGFRLLEMLDSEGPMTVSAAAERRCCARQSAKKLIDALKAQGWVHYKVAELPPVECAESAIPKSKQGEPRGGRRVGCIRLSPAGEKFLKTVLPRHMKLVLGFMRALDWRQQDSLIVACRRLRKGDPVRLLNELMFEDVDQNG